jgi:hypothetical protein
LRAAIWSLALLTVSIAIRGDLKTRTITYVEARGSLILQA